MGKQLVQLVVIYVLAAFIRWWLSNSEFQKDIAARIEIATPLNSMKRVIEGRFRSRLGLDPYESDILHESPIHFTFYTFLLDTFGKNVRFLFILFDLYTAHCLYMFSKRYMYKLFVKEEEEKHIYAKDSQTQLLVGKDLILPPLYAAVVYLFNPYTIFNCVAMTTTVIHNLILSLFFIGLIYEITIVCIAAVILSAMSSFYPIILISPLCLMVYHKKQSVGLVVVAIISTLGGLAGALYLSKTIYNGWEFLENTFGFILQVNDQQPNVGVYWYFFMEMFEHFRLLFLCSYQLNITILYFIPLSIKFRKDPPLLAACFIMLIAIFKSYPSVGDFGLTLALLGCWRHLYNCMQQIFVSSITIVITTALAPILWDLWIYWGTANANFFFGATLAFITAHIFLVTDISFAHTKREYLLTYGNYRKINGKDAKLVLE